MRKKTPFVAASSNLRSSALTALLLLAPLSFFAEALLVGTKHRPLGAATFVSVAVVLWPIAEMISRRFLLASGDRRGAVVGRIAWAVGAVSSLVACLHVLL